MTPAIWKYLFQHLNPHAVLSAHSVVDLLTATTNPQDFDLKDIAVGILPGMSTVL
jgi:hypothetical protein